jgi:hypothetical protein
MGTWERKLDDGAQRLGCMACGAHVLVVGERPGACQCCGERDLRAVAVVEAHQRLNGDLRRRFRRSVPAPALSRR